MREPHVFTEEQDELIICLGIGQNTFRGGTPNVHVLEQLREAGVVSLFRAERSPTGRRTYDLRDEGTNRYKILEMQNGRPFSI